MNHNLDICSGCEEPAFPGELYEVGHKALCDSCHDDFQQNVDELYFRLVKLIGAE